jgi:hypothetical protein
MKFLRASVVGLCIIMASCREKESVAVRLENNGTQNAALGYHINLKKSGGFAHCRELNQVAVTAQDDQLIMSASGVDPSLLLPALSMSPPLQFALEIDLTTPADTSVEIFYTTNTVQGFTPEHMVSVPVKAGRSVALFEINDPEFNGGLRFDPGQLPGQYVLYDVQYFSSGPISLKTAASKPTATP